MNPAADAAYMADAIRFAERGLYTAHPNPRVGAVIANRGKIVGRGFHLKTGEAHAEANALAEAGEASRGATVYCTLEPCSFHGRTPSCAQALIDAGVSRVVVAMVDPHPKNAGAGIRMLQDAGIEVVCPYMESSARLLNPGHVKRLEQGLPFVRLKLAMSLDGKTALANGESRWITGEPARRDVQKLRARSSAIVTGVQTVIDDDPSMTVRAGELETEFAAVSASLGRPIVILDPNLRVNADAGLLANPNTVIACLDSAPERPEINATRLRMPADAVGRIDLHELLRHLADMECNEVLFECGATLAAAVIAAGLVDELVIYAAPVMMGADARSLLKLAKIDSMHDLIELQVADVRHIGKDIRMTCVPVSRK